MARKFPCPVCKKEALPRAANPAYPFCSKRCRLIDLGKWLGEEYKVPDKQAEETEDELPTQTPPDENSPRQN
jgi:endogenous inhibitor of DNA gyrase (YacG/DUF329 family)